MKALETNIIEAFGISSLDEISFLDIGTTNSGWVLNTDGENIAAYIISSEGVPDEWGNIGWDVEVYDLNGKLLFEGWGHNEPGLDETSPLSSEGHYGAYFKYPNLDREDYTENEWLSVINEYAPIGSIEEFDASSIARIRFERVVKITDDITTKDGYRTKFYQEDSSGDIVYPESFSIMEIGGIETYYSGRDDDENFITMAMKDGLTLSPVSEPIEGVDWFMDKWIETMTPSFQEVFAYDITNHSIRTTDKGAFVLVNEANDLVAVSDYSEINPDDYFLDGGVKYAWVGLNFTMVTGEEFALQGNVALDEDGQVLQDTARFMLRESDYRKNDYDSATEWTEVVNKTILEYPELSDILTKFWGDKEPARIHKSIDRTDWDQNDDNFAITDAVTRIDIMQGNDWNAEGHIQIQVVELGYKIYVDQQLVHSKQTGVVTDNGPASAAFGANTNELIENWFDVFKDEE